MGTVWNNLRVRGDGLVPGDYLDSYQAYALHVRNDMGTVRIHLSEPSPNGNTHVTVPEDRLLDIVRALVTW